MTTLILHFFSHFWSKLRWRPYCKFLPISSSSSAYGQTSISWRLLTSIRFSINPTHLFLLTVFQQPIPLKRCPDTECQPFIWWHNVNHRLPNSSLFKITTIIYSYQHQWPHLINPFKSHVSAMCSTKNTVNLSKPKIQHPRWPLNN